MAVQYVFERDGLTEVHVHAAEPLAQLPQRPQESEHALLLLGLAGKLAYVRGSFDDALIAEIHGQEDDGTCGVAEEAAHGHGEHAGLRLQQAAGAAAAAL